MQLLQRHLGRISGFHDGKRVANMTHSLKLVSAVTLRDIKGLIILIREFQGSP